MCTWADWQPVWGLICWARDLPFGCGLVWPPSGSDLDELMGPGWALKTAEYWAAMGPDLRAKLGQKIELGLGPYLGPKNKR